ncbi:MAG: hypothetical protein JWP04_2094, partial [Belnapia sp.]|nr:hypothetical protein [Belnapia sp.]
MSILSTRQPAAAAALAGRYAALRGRTERLAAPLSPEDQTIQSMPDASPTKWHRAHVTWFFETFLLVPHQPGYRRFREEFAYLFNSYYEAAGPRHARPKRGMLTRPSAAEVGEYRAHVDAAMARLLRDPPAEVLPLVELGLQHEQQHQELLLTDIKHLLSFNPTHAPYARRWPIGAVNPQPLDWHLYDGGMFELGHDPAQDGSFCFDNETPRHSTYVAPFALASRPTTYGEYEAFIDDGGYRRPELWLAMGWDWVQTAHREAPLYWQREDGRWLNHTLQGMVEIDPHTPVCHLSFFEADAYARWAGARLP